MSSKTFFCYYKEFVTKHSGVRHLHSNNYRVAEKRRFLSFIKTHMMK